MELLRVIAIIVTLPAILLLLQGSVSMRLVVLRSLLKTPASIKLVALQTMISTVEVS
jgi:hypothetical protein